MPYGIKETGFFSVYYDKGIDWYARHFRYATGERRVGEISCYFFEPEARERIKTHIPNCKIITTMRDPVDRLYSMYKLLRHNAVARRGTFEETLNLWPSMAKGNRYASNLQGWFDQFGRENVLVTMYDELRSDPQQYLNRITGFVGIDRIALSDSPRIRDDVYAFYRAPRNRKLARKAWRVKSWLKGRQAYGESTCSNAQAYGNSAEGAESHFHSSHPSRMRGCGSASYPKSEPSKNCSCSISPSGRNRARRALPKIPCRD